jgi:hypothetical protein
MFNLELGVVVGPEVLVVDVAVLLEEVEELESVGTAAADIVESEDWAGLGPMRHKTWSCGLVVACGGEEGGGGERGGGGKEGKMGRVGGGKVKRRGCDQSRETVSGHAS